MATFLTTSRMPPELAARVEASVSGTHGKKRPDARAAGRRTLLVALARVAVVVAIGSLVATVVSLRRRDQRELEQARAPLLASVRAATASVTPEDLGAVARAESWLLRASEAYEGDFVADDVRGKDALSAVLARPIVYVRGPIAQFSSERGIAEAAAASVKDPFLVCLLEPPAGRTEKALLAKVHDAFSNGAESHSATARRLRDAQIGLPFLLPPWGALVEKAKTPEELDALRDDARRKRPSRRQKRALKAELLLYSPWTRPGTRPGTRRGATREAAKRGPTELDGERPARGARGARGAGVVARCCLRMRKKGGSRAGSRPRSGRCMRAGWIAARWRWM